MESNKENKLFMRKSNTVAANKPVGNVGRN